MKKLLLIDGNSMLFRAYWATIYGQSMSTKSGIPTNAIYGFALMLAKAIKIIEPDNVLVAFDHGKQTYRHQIYSEYKGTRSETPADLVTQFPIIREYIDALGIKQYEDARYEADDIIGSLAKQNSDKYQVTILTSDKDLLQIVDDKINVYLMHKGLSDIAIMDTQAVYQRYNLQPIQIIDLKGLAGDSSDNIPGVRKVGDKTAIKLLNEYGTIENLYDHIDQIKGKLKENLIEDKDKAFLSKKLATIITDGQIDVNIDDCKYQSEGIDAYNFYSKYEMNSLKNKVVFKKQKSADDKAVKKFEYKQPVDSKDIPSTQFEQQVCLYYDNQTNTVSISNNNISRVITLNDFIKSDNVKDFLTSSKEKIVYDYKSWLHLLDSYGLKMAGKVVDLMIVAFLTDCKIKTVDELINKYNLPIENDNNLFSNEDNGSQYCQRMLYIYPELMDRLSQNNMDELYWQIELPLVEVLFEMEKEGINCDEKILDEISVQTKEKMDYYQQKVFDCVGKQFNLNSPKQLAEVIYDDLQLARSTKRSTDIKVLEKLKGKHIIIDYIIEYRKYAKLYQTYAQGLKKYIQNDGKIHTVFNQCISETGRLSSSEPNLQNISIRNEESANIRKAFKPQPGCLFVGADYSQVELRILAHLADEQGLISAFKQGIDVHTKTAMDVFNVDVKDVTPTMRRQAKAINFGIDYGMSSFGLAERLEIPVYQASQFIQQYFEKYPNVKKFMDQCVEDCKQKGYVVTIKNRRRDIPEITSSNKNLQMFACRAAMNAPIQGSAADLIKIAMINVDRRLKKEGLKAKIILQIHDELILNCPIEEKDKVMEILQYEMEHAIELKVPLVAQASYGNDWLEVK